MRIKHRKTLWIHSVYSVFIILALIGLILIQRTIPTIILAVLLAVYVLGNTYIHIKRDDFKKETLYEYLLVSVAVFIVITSATFN